MKKIRHHWKTLLGTNKFQHAECIVCGLQKWFDNQKEKVVYQTKHGDIQYHRPNCLLP